MPSAEVEAEVHPRLTAQAISNFRTNNSVDGLEGTVDYVRFSEDLTPEKIKEQIMSGNAVFTDANGLVVNVGLGEVEQLLPQMLYHGFTENEDGTLTAYYQIVPKLGSREAVDMATANLEDTGGGLLADLGLLSSGQDRLANIDTLIDQLETAHTKVDELKAAAKEGVYFDELGLDQFYYSEQAGGLRENLIVQLDALAADKDDLQAIADTIGRCHGGGAERRVIRRRGAGHPGADHQYAGRARDGGIRSSW